MRKLADDSDVDFYDLFGLPRYCDVTKKEHLKQLRTKYLELAMVHHPDRGGDAEKMKKLLNSYNVLRNPETKRLYDDELRKKYDETTRPGGWRFWTRWITSIAMTIAGVGLILGGIVAAPVTFGASCAWAAGGGALLSAGMSGISCQINDPNMSDAEFLKAVGVSAAAGAVGGCIGAGAGAAIAQGAISAGAKVGIAAVSGASAAAAGHVMSDAVDLAITEGYCGQYLQENIRNCKTKDEIFSSKNALKFAGSVAVGALAGGVCQGVANGISQSASNAATGIADDIALSATRAARVLTASKGIAKGLTACKDVAKQALPGLAETGVNVVGNGAIAFVEETHDALQNDSSLSFGDALLHGASRAGKSMLVDAASGAASATMSSAMGRAVASRQSAKVRAANTTKIRTSKGGNGIGGRAVKVAPKETVHIDVAKPAKPTKVRTGKGVKVKGSNGAKVRKHKASRPGNTKKSTVKPTRKSNEKRSTKSRNARRSNNKKGKAVIRSDDVFDVLCSKRDGRNSVFREDSRAPKTVGTPAAASARTETMRLSNVNDNLVGDKGRMKVDDINGRALYMARNRSTFDKETVNYTDVQEGLHHHRTGTKCKETDIVTKTFDSETTDDLFESGARPTVASLRKDTVPPIPEVKKGKYLALTGCHGVIDRTCGIDTPEHNIHEFFTNDVQSADMLIEGQWTHRSRTSAYLDGCNGKQYIWLNTARDFKQPLNDGTGAVLCAKPKGVTPKETAVNVADGVGDYVQNHEVDAVGLSWCHAESTHFGKALKEKMQSLPPKMSRPRKCPRGRRNGVNYARLHRD